MATKFPSVSATSMDIGDISIGEDGQQYIVASSGKGSKTKNVWKLYEPEEVIPEIVEPAPVAPAPPAPVKKDKKDKKPKKESDKPEQEVVPEPVKELKEVKKEKKTKKEKLEKEEKVEKTKRLPNEYNRFISTKMAEYRESHPEITNGREKMKMAASEWKALKA